MNQSKNDKSDMEFDMKPRMTGKTGIPPRWLVGGVALLSLSMAAHAWVPNAKDRAAAINAGDFTAYTNQLTAWLKQCRLWGEVTSPKQPEASRKRPKH
jgi:hypothetical protein